MHVVCVWRHRQALAAFADMDLSKLSLSELCASAIDMIIDVVNDEEVKQQAGCTVYRWWVYSTMRRTLYVL